MKPFKLMQWKLIALAIISINFSIASYASEIKDYSNTIAIYKQFPQVKPFFEKAYGYAVFPAIGKGAFIIGGAYGKGQVYQNGNVTGHASLVKVSIGWQAGGQAYSQMIFFQDKRAYDEFTNGEFTFDAQASAVAVTAGVQAKANTGGETTASATAGPKTGYHAKISYHKGIAVVVHALGGLMVEVAIAGQKYGFTPLATDPK
jgi:lipid-binding SYLF domain-containing protein